jgi:hypothetical protein
MLNPDPDLAMKIPDSDPAKRYESSEKVRAGSATLVKNIFSYG